MAGMEQTTTQEQQPGALRPLVRPSLPRSPRPPSHPPPRPRHRPTSPPCARSSGAGRAASRINGCSPAASGHAQDAARAVPSIQAESLPSCRRQPRWPLALRLARGHPVPHSGRVLRRRHDPHDLRDGRPTRTRPRGRGGERLPLRGAAGPRARPARAPHVPDRPAARGARGLPEPLARFAQSGDPRRGRPLSEVQPPHRCRAAAVPRVRARRRADRDAARASTSPSRATYRSR